MLIAIKQLEYQVCNTYVMCVYLLQTHFIWLVKISFFESNEESYSEVDIIYTNTVSRDIKILFNYDTTQRHSQRRFGRTSLLNLSPVAIKFCC